ncbi:hypothetical protein [Bradyrhizobium sp. AZCC 2289]|uniref:hypothetical protein n=1 Tax=Bradyrhizobium sp. AZCC 2289 TaxID=3117026 RepID=UPI002FF19EB4
MDEPLPANVDGCAACFACNNSLGSDEEYLACILECAATGQADPELVERRKVANILKNSPALVERLKRARTETDAGPVWATEEDRVKRVLLKLARGHATFELNTPRMDEPDVYWARPLCTLSANERDYFEGRPNGLVGLWPEVGSRMLTRLVEADPDVFENGWIVVQENRYRYRPCWEDGVRIFMELRGYLACEVGWTD